MAIFKQNCGKKFPVTGKRDQNKALAKSSVIFLVMILLFLGDGSVATADGAERIENVKVEVVREGIVVSASLSQGFSSEIIHEIQNGIQKEFHYYILVKRKEPNWIFDEEVLSRSILYTVKYDTLKKIYRVIFTDGDKVVETIFDDFDAMKQMVSHVNRVKLAPANAMKSADHYYVSVKAQMRAAELPFYLDYFLFFIPFLEIDTPWADSATISFQSGE